MLQNWLKPLPASLVEAGQQLPSESLGRNLVYYQQEIPNLRNVRIALIGSDEAAANEVRAALYEYAYPFPPGSVADLGNIRKADAGQLIPILYELITGKVVPIVIGRSNDDARGQFLAYQEAKALANWTAVDEILRTSLLEPLFTPRHPLLFHFSLIGTQSHLMYPSHQKLLEGNNFELLRLGRTRAALDEAEPILRDADLLTFHLNALRNAPSASPSGFFLEEACQLTRYAGMSDKLTSFGVYGFEPEKDRDSRGAHAVSQLVWYFMEGFFNRKGDYPASLKGLNEYVVDLPGYNYQLTFWKSIATGRWWIQVPVQTTRKHLKHRLIPCSYQDYQAACRQELPDRLIKAFKRF